MSVQEKPDAVLPTMGGQTALNLAKALSEVGSFLVVEPKTRPSVKYECLKWL